MTRRPIRPHPRTTIHARTTAHPDTRAHADTTIRARATIRATIWLGTGGAETPLACHDQRVLRPLAPGAPGAAPGGPPGAAPGRDAPPAMAGSGSGICGQSFQSRSSA
jgi:hypothetical protein